MPIPPAREAGLSSDGRLFGNPDSKCLVTDTDYRLCGEDNGRTLVFSNGCTVTVPKGLPPHFVCGFVQGNPSRPVELISAGTTLSANFAAPYQTASQWSVLFLAAIETAPDTFIIVNPGASSGGGGSIEVDDGSTTVPAVTKLTFGTGATVADAGGGEARVTVPPNLTLTDDSLDPPVAAVSKIQFNGVTVSVTGLGGARTSLVNMTSIFGLDGVGDGNGVSLSLRSGSGGTGPSTGNAGDISIESGGGNSSAAYARGGNFNFRSGVGWGNGGGGGLIWDGGNSYGTGAGGGAGITGGYAMGDGEAGRLTFRGGASYGVGPAGDFRAYSGSAYGIGAAAGNIRLGIGTGSPDGELFVNNDPSLLVAVHSWVAGEQLNNRTIFITPRAMRVTAVIGRPLVANGSAATLLIVKAPSLTPPASGVALTSTSMNLAGTPHGNQTLTLSATAAALRMAPGDALCMTTVGTLTESAGFIGVWGTPQ